LAADDYSIAFGQDLGVFWNLRQTTVFWECSLQNIAEFCKLDSSYKV
jgi:hypothetical protein